MVEFNSLDTAFKLLGTIFSFPPVFLGIMLLIIFFAIRGRVS